MDASLEIYTLGGVRILHAGEPVSGLSTRKAEALLIYLASTRRQQPREVLADLFWDERTQSQAMGNLRGVLTNLRQVLGDTLLITRDQAGINPEVDVWLDTTELEDRLAAVRKQGRLNQDTARQAATALELYQGEFLQGFTVFDCRGFEDWSVRERERLHHLAVDGLSELVTFEIDEKQYPSGMAHAARLLELDPLMESAHRQMMQLLASSGQRTAALSQYETCQKLLKAELGVEPDVETRNLYEQIRTGAPAPKEEPDLLPKGTVTFLYSEVTGVSQQSHQEYGSLLAEQRRILREVCAIWNGHEVDAQGDALLVAFSRATQAVTSASETQRRLAGLEWPEGVGVRMGIHTGEPWNLSQDQPGLDVQRVRQIGHAGHTGQLLLSETTSTLVQDELPVGVSLSDLGRYLLKDSHRPEHIFQLVIDGLPAEFPPLMSLEVLPPESARAKRKVGACPYRGLAAFQEADAQFYFGRETFVNALEQAVGSKKLVAVILGSSGSGKSSAIFAGLLPRLSKAGGYLPAALRPGTQPFYSLAGAVIQLLEPGLSKTDLLAETRNLAERLTRGEVGLADVVARIHKETPEKYKLLLVIDQFEELYTLCADAQLQKAFIDELLATVEASRNSKTSLAVILLTMRADFMGQALAHRPFADALQEASVLMGPMTRYELHMAIEKPAEMQGAAFEPGLVERILDDVGEKPGNLPLLEFTLTQLWEHQSDGWLTHADYEAMGCLEGALASYADQVYADLDENEQERARQAFVQLVQPGEGTEDTRRIATHEELGDASWQLVQHLADRRLVVTGRDAQGRETAEVVHEALIQRWGKFREWMNADRAFRAWQERLRGSLRQWQESGQDEGALLAGAPLAVAQDWLAERLGELNTTEINYIHASQALQMRHQKERQRRRQWTFAGLTAGLLVAIILTAFALVQRQEAITQRQEALRQASVGLAAQALAELEGSQSERAVLMALKALENYPYTPQSEAALARAVQETLPYSDHWISLGEGGVFSLAWSPDGKFIAIGGESNGMGSKAVEIWDVTTQLVSKELPVVLGYYEANPCAVNDMAWSPDSSRLALITFNNNDLECNSFLVFDISKGNLLLNIETHGELALDWSPDGQTLLTVSQDGVTRLWDAESGILLHELVGSSSDIIGCHFSSDSARFATSYSDGSFIIWNTIDGEVLLSFGGTQNSSIGSTGINSKSYGVWDISPTWSPDGAYLATSSGEGAVGVWDTTSGERVLKLMGHTGDITHLAWSPDGSYLATMAGDSSIRLWEAASGRQILVLKGSWIGLDFSPDSHYLISGYNQLRMWDLSTLPPTMPYPPVEQIWGDVVWSPDGKYFAENAMDHEVSNDYHGWKTNMEGLIAWSPDSTRIAGALLPESAVVNAKTGEVLVVLKTPPPAPDGIYYASAWSPDGKLVASSTYPGYWTVIWNPNTGEELARTPTYDCYLMRPMFSPDSQLLATGCIFSGENTPVRIFSAYTGELVRELPSQDGWSYSPVWSQDGKYLAVTYSKAMVRIWDTTTWKIVQSFASHTGAVWDVNWSPDGTRLVSGDINGSGYVWDFATAQVVQSFKNSGLVSVDWSPDGKFIAGGTNAKYTNLIIRRAWQSTQELIDYAKECCVMRELTEEERAQFGLP
jgi:WD40 repeat protein/DNA-binding SARP family transcriptional activator